MNIELTTQQKILLQDVVDDLIVIKQELTKLSLVALIYIKNSIIQFMMSYKEYSVSNLKELGLTEILMLRALRFFKLKDSRGEGENGRAKIKITKAGVKRFVKKTAKVVLFPLYVLILIIVKLIKPKENTKTKKINKYVKNTYIE